MESKTYIYLFTVACVGFMVYNELILLPYQIWDPSGYRSKEDMRSRNPLVNVGVILGSFLLLSAGSYSYVSYLEGVKVMDPEGSLADLSTMKDSTKGRSG